MEKNYILAIDQSTSATKALLFNRRGELVQRCNRAHQQYYPQPGWVEHDAEEIYQRTLEAIEDVLAESGTKIEQILALALTNQRETVVVWEKQTGKPLGRAVVWQCRRGEGICRELGEQGYREIVFEKTGLVLSPYFSAAKIKWVLDNVAGAREKAEAGELLWGTIDSWLIWKLSGVHATDYSNASRTQLFNLDKLAWDEELFRLFTIPLSMAPEVKSSNALFGYSDLGLGGGIQIPLTGVMGDSHAALFGQCCFREGMVKATYGTGSSIMMNIGKKRLRSQQGLVTSLAWGLDGEVEYVLEGNINCTGATIKWVVEALGLIPDAESAGRVASALSGNEGVYLVPAFVGLNAPYWDSEAKAAILGLAMGIGKEHIVRAAVESIAYQIKDVLEVMVGESAIKLQELRVDGGPTRNDFLMQFQADLINASVLRNRLEELSAAGVAYMAGLAMGVWQDKAEIASLQVQDRIFSTAMSTAERDRLYGGWQEAVKRVLTKG